MPESKAVVRKSCIGEELLAGSALVVGMVNAVPVELRKERLIRHLKNHTWETIMGQFSIAETL